MVVRHHFGAYMTGWVTLLLDSHESLLHGDWTPLHFLALHENAAN